MDNQDWTTVTIKRKFSKKEHIKSGQSAIQVRDLDRNEKIRLAKLDSLDIPVIKKRIQPESLQSLIRKRIELKLNQEKADNLCAFPKNTFKDIESNKLIPNEEQKRRIQINFGIQLKIDTLST